MGRACHWSCGDAAGHRRGGRTRWRRACRAQHAITSEAAVTHTRLVSHADAGIGRPLGRAQQLGEQTCSLQSYGVGLHVDRGHGGHHMRQSSYYRRSSWSPRPPPSQSLASPAPSPHLAVSHAERSRARPRRRRRAMRPVIMEQSGGGRVSASPPTSELRSPARTIVRNPHEI